MNDMSKPDVLYNALVACGMKPEREMDANYEYVIHDVFVHVFRKGTGDYIDTAVKKHHATRVIKI